MPQIPPKKISVVKNKVKTPFQKRMAELQKPGSDEMDIGSSDQDVGEKIKTASYADIAKLVSGVRWLLKQWIPRGMVSMLFAPPGMGKSFFALIALIAPVITDRDWFNGTRGPKTPGKVLLLDTEGTAGITVQRIKDCGLPIERILTLFPEDVLKSVELTNDEHFKLIEKLIVQEKISLIVVDSLSGGHSEDENNSRVGKLIKRLTAIAERTGAAFLIIHHTRKLRADEEMSAERLRNGQTK